MSSRRTPTPHSDRDPSHPLSTPPPSAQVNASHTIGQPGFFTHVRAILVQSWPILVSAWASVAFGVIDTAMTGHASAADLQAMSLSISIYLMVFITLMGVLHAIIPIAGQHYGARRLRAAGEAWNQGMWLALGLSLVGGALMLWPTPWLSLAGDLSPAVRDSVTWYLRGLALALPAALVFRTFYALCAAVSRTQIIMVINLGAIVLKVAFNWVLIFGTGLTPALGAAGAGFSTALVSWIMMAAGAWWVLRHDLFFRDFHLRIRRPRWRKQVALLRLGLPMGGSYLIEICGFSIMALLVAREGIFASGGHQIMSNLAALCYMMPMAIGVASASLVAQSIGAGDPAQARSRGRASLAVALTGAVTTAVLVLLAREPIVAAYTNSAEVAAVASALLLMLPLFHLADAMQCVNSYLLRAYKVAVVPLVLQAFALTGIGLVGGWWLGFGPAAGALAPVLRHNFPGAPIGAATLWVMAIAGMLLSASLLFALYYRVSSRYMYPRRHG